MKRPELGEKTPVKALCMLSGGLDSQLAICVLRDQGIEVEAVVFDSPFFETGAAIRAAKALDVKLHIVDLSDEILELLKGPPHGFGKCMNPCIDCHARMMQRCHKMLPEIGASFIATGEVLSQRPMSQNRQSLGVVAKESGCGDIVLRPLSAKLLDPTKPELEGLVDRERLLDLSGRGRKPQFELAKKFGVVDYPSPAGGCRLTEPNFSKRLAELIKHEGLDICDIELLRLGRHFRFDSGVKLIVGRNAKDNEQLEKIARKTDIILNVDDIPGPVALLPVVASDDDVTRAAEICARYCDSEADQYVNIRVVKPSGSEYIKVLPEDQASIEQIRI